MKIAVTGATGFIGKPLVRSLLGAGYEVRALSRNAKRATRLLPVGCECQEWDAARELDPSSLSGSDAVIHLAGEGIADRRWTEDHKAAVRASRVGSTIAIVRAIRGMPAGERPRTFISASAIGYYGDRGDEELVEGSGPGQGYLAEVCRAWEEAALAAADAGLRRTAIRIGIVLGRQGGALRQFLPAFRLGMGGRLGVGSHWMSWIHLQDVVRLFHHVLECRGAAGPINAVAPEPVRNRRFTTELGRVLHRPTYVPMPAWALRLGLGGMSTVLLSSQRVLPACAERLRFEWRFPRLADALDDLCSDLGEEFECEHWIPRPIEEVFPFFADAYNLQRITPPFLHFRVLGTSANRMGEGVTIRCRLRVHGVPMSWQSRIESWEPGRRFVDRQIRGPYRSWCHTHEFAPHEGGTIVRDRVRYELPLGPLGDLVLGRFVSRDVSTIFEFRRDKMGELFGAAPIPVPGKRPALTAPRPVGEAL